MAMDGGPIREIKIPVQELWLKMWGAGGGGPGGGYMRREAYMRDTTVL